MRHSALALFLFLLGGCSESPLAKVVASSPAATEVTESVEGAIKRTFMPPSAASCSASFWERAAVHALELIALRREMAAFDAAPHTYVGRMQLKVDPCKDFDFSARRLGYIGKFDMRFTADDSVAQRTGKYDGVVFWEDFRRKDNGASLAAAKLLMRAELNCAKDRGRSSEVYLVTDPDPNRRMGDHVEDAASAAEAHSRYGFDVMALPCSDVERVPANIVGALEEAALRPNDLRQQR
jgi:hypothetical protein